MTEILQNVDATKKEKFNEKYNRLNEKDWTRDNFESNMREVRNAIDNIEDFITGLQDQIDDIYGDKPGVDSDFDEIKSDFNDASANEVSELEQQSMAGGYNPTLKALEQKQVEVADLLQKVIEWKTLQGELSRLAMQKVFRIAQGYRKEFINSDVAENFEMHAEQIVEEKVERAKQEIKQEFTRDVADLEQAVNAARNETKNAWTFMQKFAEQSGSSELQEVPQNALLNGLDQFATGDGLVDLSGEAKQVEETKKERQEARESAVEESLDKSGTTSGSEVEEDLTAREDLLEHWDDYYSLLDSKTEISKELGVSPGRVTQLMNEEDLEL